MKVTARYGRTIVLFFCRCELVEVIYDEQDVVSVERALTSARARNDVHNEHRHRDPGPSVRTERDVA